jgi:hypothetical protein
MTLTDPVTVCIKEISLPAAERTKELLALFKFPALMLVLAIFPGINCFIYSGHGGLGWFILPFCTPYVLLRLAMLALHDAPIRQWFLKYGTLLTIAWMFLSLPLSYVAVRGINACTHMELRTYEFYKMITFPVGLVLPPYGEANRRAIEDAFWFL